MSSTNRITSAIRHIDDSHHILGTTSENISRYLDEMLVGQGVLPDEELDAMGYIPFNDVDDFLDSFDPNSILFVQNALPVSESRSMTKLLDSMFNVAGTAKVEDREFVLTDPGFVGTNVTDYELMTKGRRQASVREQVLDRRKITEKLADFFLRGQGFTQEGKVDLSKAWSATKYVADMVSHPDNYSNVPLSIMYSAFEFDGHIGSDVRVQTMGAVIGDSGMIDQLKSHNPKLYEVSIEPVQADSIPVLGYLQKNKTPAGPMGDARLIVAAHYAVRDLVNHTRTRMIEARGDVAGLALDMPNDNDTTAAVRLVRNKVLAPLALKHNYDLAKMVDTMPGEDRYLR